MQHLGLSRIRIAFKHVSSVPWENMLNTLPQGSKGVARMFRVNSNTYLTVISIEHTVEIVGLYQILKRCNIESKYNKGPSMDPCGTSNSRYLDEDTVSPMITLRERPCKYDENLCRAVPEKPKYDLSLSTRRVWSSVSNTADRSSITSTTSLWESRVFKMSSVTLSNAVSVKWCCLYADRRLGKRPCCLR